MTYLCIATIPGAAPRRRVDLGDIAALFAEEGGLHDRPVPASPLGRATSKVRSLLLPLAGHATHVRRTIARLAAGLRATPQAGPRGVFSA